MHNKRKKYFVTPFVKLTLLRLEWCIESIFKEFGGNVDLVIVINPTLLENDRKNFKSKEEIIKKLITIKSVKIMAASKKDAIKI